MRTHTFKSTLIILLACTVVAAKKATDDGNVDPSTLPPPNVKTLKSDPPPDGVQSLTDTIVNLVQAVCRFESGAGCTDVDVFGTSKWYKDYFKSHPPTAITSELGPPMVPEDGQIVSNQTVSMFWCPARSFAYTCRLDKQYFEQTTHTTTNSHAWSVGQTTKVQGTYGVKFVGCVLMQLMDHNQLYNMSQQSINRWEGGVGPFVQYSFSYQWNIATAEAHTEQETTVQSTTVHMPANSTKCLLLTTVLSAIDANGTEPAWGTASGWCVLGLLAFSEEVCCTHTTFHRVGTYQQKKRSWKWDTKGGEYYYRAFTLGQAVQVAQANNLPEARDFAWWNDDAANITSIINLQFNVGSSGHVNNNWYDKTSTGTYIAVACNCNDHSTNSPTTECTQWDPSIQKQAQPQGTVINAATGEEEPVLDAIRIQ